MTAPITTVCDTIDPIAGHANGCPCPRCADLTDCPVCGEQKLDIDWCFACRRMVFMDAYGGMDRCIGAAGKSA
jgi:hypothetical protein